eukprot:9797553-Alexandrium_andersonii.AAC.1
MGGLCYVDDGAYAFDFPTPASAVAAAPEIIAAIRAALAEKGLSVDLTAGKTEALFWFVGRGSKEYSLRFQRDPWIELPCAQGCEWLHVAREYTHLGTIFANKQDWLEPEIRTRVAAGWRALARIKHALATPQLPTKDKLNL